MGKAEEKIIRIAASIQTPSLPTVSYFQGGREFPSTIFKLPMMTDL